MHVHVDDVELRKEAFGVVSLMSFVLDGSSLRCRSVLLESTLCCCKLRYSLTLKAVLLRSIEVVLDGNFVVAELSTGFEKSLIYQRLPFVSDDQISGILFKKREKVYAPFYLAQRSSRCWF